MNKRLCTFLLSAFLCCILTFALYPLVWPPAISRQSVFKQTEKNHAFATILCDPLMVDATLVSIYSLKVAFTKKPSSESDIIVLIPDSVYVENETTRLFEKLGAQIIKTSFSSSSCVNSEQDLLHLWGLFDYKSVVYFTHDILFNNDVDQLFRQLPNSAILSNEVVPLLLLLEPSPENFESMVQGRKSLNPILSQVHDHTKILLDSKNIYAFTEPMKPWNFHSHNEVDWRKYYDPVSFYNWRRLNNDLKFFLNSKNQWKNKERQNNVCSNYIESAKENVNYFPVRDQFSVMISTYNPERIEHLSQIVQHLLKSDKMHTVFITWHNPSLEIPSSLYDYIRKEDYFRVKVLKQTYDSLNNRFNPVDGLQTDAVYIMDDDIFIDLKDLEFTFDVWRSRKDSVVGHFPRLHKYDPATQKAIYKIIKKTPYTIILTKSMFIHSDYLFAYTW
ncbi:unnamed protein product [Rhizopus stolonifer]